MKKLILLSSFLLIISSCFCQKQKIQDPYSGMETEMSGDKKILILTNIKPGSPADIAPLLLGDRIVKINGRAIPEITDLGEYFKSIKYSDLNIEVKRTGEEIYPITIPRTSINLFSSNILTEAELYCLVNPVQDKNYTTNEDAEKAAYNDVENKILSSVNPKAYSIYNASGLYNNVTFHLKRNISNSNQVTILRDYNYDMLNYKTYDFDYLSKDDPLTEKSLLYKFETYLQRFGLKRNSDNPDILIIISFYSGQKEQYIPPQLIISTKIQGYFNWYWGNIPVPITESRTKEGYSKITYLTNINLKFLDFKTISTSKTPPVIWSASYSEVSPVKTFLTERADDIFNCFIYQYPIVVQENFEDFTINNYAYTGLVWDKANIKIIADVIPVSPAWQAGLRKGDEIIRINEKRMPDNFPGDGLIISWGRYAFSGQVSFFNAFTYLFNNSVFKDADPGIFRPLKEVNINYLSGEPLSFRVKRERKEMDFKVNPQYKDIITYKNIGFTID